MGLEAVSIRHKNQSQTLDYRMWLWSCMSFLYRVSVIACVLETGLGTLDLTRVSTKKSGQGWATGMHTLDQGRPGLQSEGKNGHGVSTPRTKEGKLEGSGREGQKEPLGSRGRASLFMKSSGPVSGGSHGEASPVMREMNTIPKSKGLFTLAEWLVLRRENTLPLYTLAQVCVLVLWTAGSGGGISLLKSGLSQPPPPPPTPALPLLQLLGWGGVPQTATEGEASSWLPPRVQRDVSCPCGAPRRLSCGARARPALYLAVKMVCLPRITLY